MWDWLPSDRNVCYIIPVTILCKSINHYLHWVTWMWKHPDPPVAFENIYFLHHRLDYWNSLHDRKQSCIVSQQCCPIMGYFVLTDTGNICQLLNGWRWLCAWLGVDNKWPRHIEDANLRTTFSNIFSRMRMIEFWLNIQYNLLLMVQLTISQHWLGYWLVAWLAPSHYLSQWGLN